MNILKGFGVIGMALMGGAFALLMMAETLRDFLQMVEAICTLLSF